MKVSPGSIRLSALVVTDTVFDVAPAGMVTVPVAALKSEAPAVPAAVA